MEVALNEVFAAIDTLYCDQSNAAASEQKENLHKASEWLGNLQKSVQSWKIADQLLHMKRDIRSCFFASQTLRTKIQYYFVELPLESHESFRNSMLDHLSHITDDTHQGIATQLCVAVADLVLLMSSWQDPFGDICSEFGAGGRRCNLVPLLEVLIALPEELNSRQLRLGQKRREHMEAYCKSQVPRLIQLLHAVITSDNRQEIRVLRCLSSWFNLHCAEWEQLMNTSLVNFMLAIVADPRVPPRQHEIATDCVCATMIMLEEVQIPALSQVLFASVLQLEEAFHIAVALEDLAAVTNYARMFAELGETLVPLIVSQQPDNNASTQVLNLLLMCVGHHEWEVAEITFNFWYKLSEDLYRKNCDNVNAMFMPYIERLFEALYRHCQIDVDHEGVLQDSDDFYEFRERVQELIKDVVFICRSKVCFDQMATILRAPETLKSWHLVEAALFVMQSVAKNLVPEDDNAVVTEVVEGVLSQAAPAVDGTCGGVHVQVALTSLQLLAELNEWFSYHPALLPNVLTFCTQRLHCPPLATLAAKALDAICSCCHAHMEPHFVGLMQIVCSLDSMMVSNTAVIGLLKGVTNVLNQFSNAAIRTHMDKLCGLQVDHLTRLLQSPTESAERGSSDDPIIWLDRLSAVFRHVNPSLAPGEEHPCRDVVMKVWPAISGIMEKYRHDVRVMEHCCRCLRFAVRCVHKASAPMLPPLVTTIVKLYGESGHSCFVYLGSILVDEYGTEAGCVSGLISMLEAFTPKTFELLIQPQGFKNHPDTVDDWFRLCTRFLQRCPLPFLQCPVISTIIECGLQACLLDHKDANAAVLKFFQDLLLCGLKGTESPSYAARREMVEKVLSPHSSKLVDNLISGAIFVLPPYMHHEVAETLLQLCQFDRGRFCAMLEAKLRTIPRNNSSGHAVVTFEQIQELHTTITSATRSKEIAKALIDFSRYYT
ncbi:transportin-3 [Hyalella azteca]|uniref:Transportin-3 n=1 Tax=Hyalella azteca TaxID=294128 RepID=A0A8B7N0T4_HYAAZ|nr:transportin-3 [Hyalella azteca]